MTAALLLAGCSVTPPPRSPDIERQIQRARSQQRDATSAQSSLEQERTAANEALERVQAEIVAVDAPHHEALARYRADKLVFDSYDDRIEAANAFAATCHEQADAIVAAKTGAALASALADYVSEPERDRALQAMDKCRKALVGQARRQMQDNLVELQRDVKIDIEDTFDENNPYSRGGLSATIKGSQLRVRMRGNFEGRARHSQDQVDMWCIAGNGLFTQVTLKNSHGTFVCRPSDTPQALMDTILEDTGVKVSWVASGEQPTPTLPSEPGAVPAELELRRQQLVVEAGRLEAAIADVDARAQELVLTRARAQQTLNYADRQEKSATQAWGQKKITRSANAQVAGVAFGVIGGALLLGTVGATQAGVEGAKDFVPIGVGVSVPVIVTGILFLVGGGGRKKQVRQALGCTGVGVMPSYCMPSR